MKKNNKKKQNFYPYLFITLLLASLIFILLGHRTGIAGYIHYAFQSLLFLLIGGLFMFLSYILFEDKRKSNHKNSKIGKIGLGFLIIMSIVAITLGLSNSKEVIYDIPYLFNPQTTLLTNINIEVSHNSKSPDDIYLTGSSYLNNNYSGPNKFLIATKSLFFTSDSNQLSKLKNKSTIKVTYLPNTKVVLDLE